MSTTIDQRVVEMRFDNKQFESGVSTTMSTLDKLKKSLNLKGASQGLEEVGAAAKNCDISIVGTAAEKVGLKFSAMFSIADQALRNITNSAMNAGKRIVSALTIDPVKTGFKEYETQINAIQTILANTESKGTTLEDVNGALDELNTYADKTIYNFTEMTRNIGTFTAAGVDLDTSVSAIKGIANLAAVSGSTSQQASTAMYQLSQAMASGTVKLMDWNSVVNAGMGGQVFQDALKETARVHGIAIDDIIKKNGSFRESLSDGWLTTEILTDTLAKFTGDLSEEQLKSKGYTEEQIKEIMKLGQTANDAATKVKTFTQLFDTLKEAAQSGWTQTWEILVGDFEEAKALLTTLSDTIGGFINNMSESRNEMLENWKVMGGRQDLIDSFKNVFEGLVSIIKPISAAFKEIFPPMTAERLVKMTQSLKEFTAKLKLSDEGAENLKRTFKGIFSVFKLAGTIISAVVKAVGKLFTGVGYLGGGLLSVTAVLGDFIASFIEIISRGNLLEKVFNGVATVFNFVAKVIATLVKGFGALFEFIGHGLVFPGVNSLIAGLKGVFDSLMGTSDAAESFKEKVTGAFANAGEALRNNPLLTTVLKVWEVIKTIGTSIYKFVTKIFSGLMDKLATGDIIGILDVVNTFISGGVGVALIKFLKGFEDAFGDFAGLGESIGGLLESVSGSFKAFQNSLNANALKQIAIAIAILAAGILVLSFINKDKLTDSLSAIVVLFAGLMGAMAVSAKGGGIAQMAGIASAMVGLSIGVLILATAMKKISALDTDEVVRGLLGIVGIMGAMALVMRAMTFTKSSFVETYTDEVYGFTKSTETMKVSIIQMIGLAIAAKILASVLADIAYLEWDELGRGIVGLTTVMVLLVAAMKILPLGTENIGKPFWKFCAQMILVTKAAKMLAGSLVMLADLEWDELWRGVIGLTAVMTLLVASMKILAASQDVAKTTQKTTFKSTTNFIGMATMVAAMAVAIRILVPAIREIGEMEWGDLGKFGAVLGGLTASIILITSLEDVVTHKARKASFTSTEVKRDLGGLAGTLLSLAVAIRIMAPAMKEIAAISWPDLGKFGAVLAGVTGTIVLMSLMHDTFKTTKTTSFKETTNFTGMATALVVLAASLLLMVPAIKAISSMEWGDLAKAGAVIAALVGVLAIFSTLTLIPTFNATSMILMSTSLSILAATLGLLIVPLLALELVSWGAIIKGLVVLAGGLVALGLAGTYLAPVIPVMLGLAGAFAIAGLGMLAFGTGLAYLSGGLSALAGAMVLGFGSMMGSIVILIKGLFDAADVFVVELLDFLTKCTVAFCTALIETTPVICEALKVVVLALCDLLLDLAPPIVDTVAELLIKVLESLDKFVPDLVDILLSIVIKVIDGVAERAPELVLSLVNLFAKVFEALGKALGGFDGDSLLKGVAAFGAMALLVKTFAKINVKDIGKALAGLGCVSLLILELIAVMAVIGLLFGSDSFRTFISSGGDLLGELSIALLKGVPAFAAAYALMKVCSTITVASAGAAIKGIALLSLIVAELAILLAAIGLLAPLKGAINQAGEILGAIGTALGQFLGGLAGGYLAGMSTGLVAIGAAMRLFYEEIKGIKFEKIKDAAKGAIYIAAAVAAMALVSKIPTSIKDMGIYLGSVVALGAAIGLFSLSVSNVDVAACESAAKASLWIALAVGAMTAVSFITGLQGAKGVINAGLYTLSVVAIGASLSVFSDLVKNVNPSTVEAAAKAANWLSLAVVAMSGASLLSAIGTLMGLGDLAYLGAVTTIGESMRIFSEKVSGVDPTVVQEAAEAAGPLSEAVCGMAGSSFLAALSSIVGKVSYYGAVVTIGEAMYAFSEEVDGINTNAVSTAASAADDLTSTVTKMAGSSFLTALSGIVGKVSYYGAVVTIGEAMKKFSDEVDGINPEAVSSAASAADTLNGVILKMAGTGILTALSGLLTLGGSFITYKDFVAIVGESMSAFSEKAKDVDPGVVTSAAGAADTLNGVILKMAGAGVLTALSSLLTLGGSFITYKDFVAIIGESLSAFSEKVKDVDPGVVSAAASAADTLNGIVIKMAGAGIVTALATLLSLGGGMITYKDCAATVGETLSAFSEKVKDVDPEAVTAAAQAAGPLTTAVMAMAGSGIITAISALLSIGFGWVTYKECVSTIGESMKVFSEKVAGIDPAAVSAAASAASDLSGAVVIMAGANILNALLGFANAAIGTELYKKSVTTIGESMKAFSSEVAGIDPVAVSAAAGAANDLSSAVLKMTEGGFLNALANFVTAGGANQSFSDTVKDIGKAIKGFSGEVVGIDPTAVSAAAGAAKDLADAVMVLPTDTSHVIGFGDNIVKFAEKLAAYFSKTAEITSESINSSTNALNAIKSITTIDTAKIDAVSTSIDKIAKSITDLSKVPGDSLTEFKTSLEEVGKTSVDGFVESFEGLSKKLKKKADEARKAFVEAFEKIEKDMNDVGEDSITEFRKGADNRKDKAISAFEKIAKKCAEALSDKSKSFWNAGKALVQGFADGISENSYIAEAKAKAMAEAAYEAGKEALDVNSPSKVFRALGYSIPEGLAAGIDKLSGMAAKSSKDMANDSIDGVKRTLSNLASIITSDVNAQPTIRPVLDLSEVESGANSIGKMLGSSASVGISANIGAINSAMRQRNQNGANDVVAEISKLRTDLADTDRASYTINGITISGDEEVEAAFKTILRAARMDRRM